MDDNLVKDTGATKTELRIARILGKGTDRVAAALVVPTVDKLEHASAGKDPALFIIGVLSAEKAVGADKILDVTFETMANRFYEKEKVRVLKRLEQVATNAQEILADLFFKAGFGDEPFKVTLDLGMIAVLNDVFYVWIDGAINVNIVRGKSTMSLRKAFGKPDKDNFTGSGRLEPGDKLFVSSEGLEKAGWVIEQLVSGTLGLQNIAKGVGVPGANKVGLVLDYGGVALEEAVFDGPTVAEVTKKLDEGAKVEEVAASEFANIPEEPKDEELEPLGKTDKNIQTKIKGVGEKVRDGQFVQVVKKKAVPKAKELVSEWAKNVGFALSALSDRLFSKNKRRVIKTTHEDTMKMYKGIGGLVLVVGLCVIIGMAVNRSFNGRKAEQEYVATCQKLDDDVASFETRSASVEEKLSEASVFLLQVDELMLSEFADVNALSAIETRVTKVTDDLTGTVPIDSVVVIADLAVSLDNAVPVDFDIKGDLAYVLDAGNNVVYTVDLITGEISTHASAPESDPVYISWGSDDLFVYDAQNGTYKINSDGSADSVAGLSALSQTVGELATYPNQSNNLYWLVPTDRSVYKSKPSGGSYPIASKYNDSPFPLNSSDIAIDRSIYAIGEAGDIKVFDGVQMNDFAVHGLYQPLGANCKLDTLLYLSDEVDNYLYILDPSKKRIVIVDKTVDGNNFVGQIQYRGGSPWFENIKEMKVTDDERYAIILDGSALIKVEL